MKINKLKSDLNKDFKLSVKDYLTHILLFAFTFAAIDEMTDILKPTAYVYNWFWFIYLLMAFLFSVLYA